MKRTKKMLACIMLGFAVSGFMFCSLAAKAAQKQTIYSSSYVTFAPDGKAWTTNAENRSTQWYKDGTMVSTGISSSIHEPERGEHYYFYQRSGEIPVGSWKVKLGKVYCCHDDYPPSEKPYYHNIVYNRFNCLNSHYSGWNPYCADCGERITGSLIYMSRQAAETIDYFEVGTDMDYYYLCPFCRNLEQGTGFDAHVCKGVSWNQYKVIYDVNTLPSEQYGGYMPDSVHMYNNATEYEGKTVTPVTHLTENAYTRIGYEFVEWNTAPDGSGQRFQDGAEILNLTDKDKSEGGEVILYAQWRKSSATLKVNPNGGAYNGTTAVTTITGSYGTNYKLLNHTIKAPKGYTVSFQTNGGNKVSPITGTRHFTEWSMVNPFGGRIKDDTYYFIVPKGNVDTILANYEPDPITLPAVTKAGSSFGGWYYDSACTKPAGGAGDQITPSKDITLYAAWVDLKLSSKDNYKANEGKGAVDLSWTQSDQNNKSYKIYQSRDGSTWKLITSANDIGNQSAVSESFSYTGESKNYTVPYSGIYTLTASGAKGGNYGSYKGGNGGSVTTRVWLNRGEKLTCKIGGKNGYGGGGTGSVYGNGGGATTVTSNIQGTLLIAGGGGGAGASGDGGAGGSSVSLRADGKKNGASGQSGGGAGYVGGNAGELITHSHTESCYVEQSLAYTFHDYAGEASVTASFQNYSGSVGSNSNQNGISVGGHSGLDNDVSIQIGKKASPIPTKGNKKLAIPFYFHAWGDTGTNIVANTYKFKIYNQAGKLLKSIPLEYTEIDTGGDDGIKEYTISKKGSPYEIDLPSGTTGIYIDIYIEVAKGDEEKDGNWTSIEIGNLKFTGGTQQLVVCGYTEGQIISSKPAYGGSNYVNTAVAYEYSQSAGTCKGDGSFSIRSEAVGYLDVLSLEDVVAADFAMPDPVSAKSVTKEALSDTQVKVLWQAPADNGTEYYHVAESYIMGSASPLCRSNVTKNTLISGLKGYYFLTDSNSSTAVTALNGTFTGVSNCMVSVGTQAKYLHVAAVDKAGNISNTLHIKIEARDVAWKLYTEQIAIDEGENVYPAEVEKTWYVRADGNTPFTLRNMTYLAGIATVEYQPNYIIYETVTDGVSARNIIYSPSAAIQNGTLRTDAEGLSYTVEGNSALTLYPYSYTVRTEQNRKLSGVQAFTVSSEVSGKSVRVIPIAGADWDKEILYSDYEADRNNSLTLIGDGEAPVIRGTELLEDAKLINRNDGTVVLNITASDNLSGIRDFYLEITNEDNGGNKIYRPGNSGNIKVEITADESIFSGDFEVRVYASDNVGNETEKIYATTEFALVATIERILEPHDPIFKRGESGILTITTWGYAERIEVEFPEEFTAVNPDLNKTYLYTEEPLYKQQEQIQFMVPLNVPENMEHTITVRAYKGDKRLEEYPSLSTITVNGSVLDEFRTRLR